MFSDNEDSSNSFDISNINYSNLFLGILIIVVGVTDMLVFYLVANNFSKENKKKYTTANFEKTNKSIIAIHFVLHILVISIGISFVIKSIIGGKLFISITILVLLGLIFVFWIVEICLGFLKTRKPKSYVTTEKMTEILTKTVSFRFIYSRDGSEYSMNGVSIPISAQIISPLYNFTNLPSFFYFDFIQKLKMTSALQNEYNLMIEKIKNCGYIDKYIKTEDHPLIAGTYIVTKDKIPMAINKHSRTASIIFGVGVYYEIISKSYPIYSFIQESNADVVPNHKYSFIGCREYGNTEWKHKPKP